MADTLIVVSSSLGPGLCVLKASPFFQRVIPEVVRDPPIRTFGARPNRVVPRTVYGALTAEGYPSIRLALGQPR